MMLWKNSVTENRVDCSVVMVILIVFHSDGDLKGRFI